MFALDGLQRGCDRLCSVSLLHGTAASPGSTRGKHAHGRWLHEEPSALTLRQGWLAHGNAERQYRSKCMVLIGLGPIVSTKDGLQLGCERLLDRAHCNAPQVLSNGGGLSTDVLVQTSVCIHADSGLSLCSMRCQSLHCNLL